MEKQIVLSAEESMIERVEDLARLEGKNLDGVFREFLEKYIDENRILREYYELTSQMNTSEYNYRLCGGPAAPMGTRRAVVSAC